MDKTIALFIAGIVLLIVAGTMGEDGAVSRLAERGQAGPVQAEPAPASAAPAARPVEQSAGQDWFAAGPQQAQSALPVYHYEKVEIHVPQEVVDPAVAAASEIK